MSLSTRSKNRGLLIVLQGNSLLGVHNEHNVCLNMFLFYWGTHWKHGRFMYALNVIFILSSHYAISPDKSFLVEPVFFKNGSYRSLNYFRISGKSQGFLPAKLSLSRRSAFLWKETSNYKDQTTNYIDIGWHLSRSHQCKLNNASSLNEIKTQFFQKQRFNNWMVNRLMKWTLNVTVTTFRDEVITGFWWCPIYSCNIEKEHGILNSQFNVFDVSGAILLNYRYGLSNSS